MTDKSFITKLDHRVPCLGIIFIILSSFAGTSGKLFVKKVGVLNPFVIIFVRCLMLTIFWLFVIAIRRDYIFGKTLHETKLLLLRGLFGFLIIVFSYYAIEYLPLSDATTILLSTPIYTSLISYIVFKEKCSRITTILMFVILSGVILIARPSFIFGNEFAVKDEHKYKTIGCIFAVLSSMFAALHNITLRKLKAASASVVVFWFAMFGVIGSGICIIIAKNTLPADQVADIRMIDFKDEIVFLCCNACAGLFAQLFTTLALKVEEPTLISMCRSFDIVLSFIFQALFLKHEHILWTSIAGAVVVGAGIFLSAVSKMYERRNQSKKEKENPKIIKNSDVESNSSVESSPDLTKIMDKNSKNARI